MNGRSFGSQDSLLVTEVEAAGKNLANLTHLARITGSKAWVSLTWLATSQLIRDLYQLDLLAGSDAGHLGRVYGLLSWSWGGPRKLLVRFTLISESSFTLDIPWAVLGDAAQDICARVLGRPRAPTGRRRTTPV